ncbi:MAG: exopolysaccharide biosynthesis protein, partial [Verrucomicrobiota bacterium]
MSESASHTLSEDIKALLLEAGERDLSIQEIEFMLRGRGFALLIMLLAAPFLIPNVPGLSTPFGAAITMMGARLAFGRKPWLPKFVLAKRLSSATLQKILGMLLKISLRLERMVKPRMCFLHRWPGTMNLIGVGIASGGFFLALPLPIPLTNTLPAISILLLTAGMMEEDGVCVLIGYVMGILAWVYLIA